MKASTCARVGLGLLVWLGLAGAAQAQPATAPFASPPSAPPARAADVPPASASLLDATTAGKAAADQTDALAYVALGSGAACLGSCVGCAASTASMYLISPAPPAPPEDEPVAYRRSYAEAYQDELRFKRASYAFIGGAVTTAALLGLVTFAIVMSNAK